MGDLAEKLLVKTDKEYATILGLNGNPDDATNILRQQSSSSLLKGIKEFHDSIHSFDGAGRSEFISELITNGMHDEQVWQQQEFQMDAVKRYLHEQFTVRNLEQLPLRFALSSKKTGEKLHGQTAVVQAESMEDDKDSDDDDDDDDDDEPVVEADSDDSDPELSKIKKRLGNQDGFDDFDDSDNDLFDGAEEEWGKEEEKDDDEDENNFDFELPTKKSKKKEVKTPKTNKRKTEVDDEFFKLADMEEFLDREDAKEEKKTKRGGEEESDGSDESDNEDDGGQKLDMFASWSDEETGKEFMYSDFFDPPGEGDNTQQAMVTQSEGEESEENEGEESEEGEGEEEESDEEDMETESDDEDRPTGSKKTVRFSDSAKTTNEQGNEKQSLSSFEKRTEKLRRQIQALEEQSVAEKPWQLSGEVGARDRPENSMLEEHVDFKQAPPTAAEMTAERSQSIEEIILQRIKDKSFDDNQRQVRPVEEAFELKTERTLDQEKSKLSLHEVYEQEFLKLQTPEDEEKTNPVHDEIKKMMSDLFPRLDALASWHYTPLQAVPELRVKNNLPSVRMEEPTPLTMSSATAMAPEEIQARKKGDLKGKTERTKEDKHRERKKKKAAKREKMKEKEKRRKEVEKLNPGLGNKYSKERALKELEKEASGNIEVIKDKKSKKSMSSKAFFSQLQEEVTSQTSTKAKKKLKQKSSDKLLL